MKILFLSAWFPYPPINGSKIRIYHLLKALSNYHDVWLLAFMRDGEHTDPGGLERWCCSVDTVAWREFSPHHLRAILGFFSRLPRSSIDSYSREMAERVRQVTQHWKPDGIVASQTATASYAEPYPQFPRILEEVEIGLIRQNWSNDESFMFRLRRQANWAKVRSRMKSLIPNFDACTVVSETEGELLNQIVPNYQHIYLIPNGVDLENLRPGLARPGPNTLIYNGALTYNANYDAMDFFLNEIFPHVQAQVSEVILKITGSTEGVDRSRLPLNDHVILTGFLQDIRPAVAGSWACIVPLRLGGGTRLKILEAMALGTPVVATSKAVEGLVVTPGQDILIADDPIEFASQTVRLLGDPNLRANLSINGRRLVEKLYGWDAIGQKFEQVLESVMKARVVR